MPRAQKKDGLPGGWRACTGGLGYCTEVSAPGSIFGITYSRFSRGRAVGAGGRLNAVGQGLVTPPADCRVEAEGNQRGQSVRHSPVVSLPDPCKKSPPHLQRNPPPWMRM
ncbi:hypothetical protein GDO81_028521 [Engystomops pustulosus]|uniref:Uncharacterized protein n=1 Tax=Engystomops pustulosus TaxID=76066 RepID=A0AAV6YJR0_ENGPU|nr:hypothetical protein GDO81_028521 [Engystomops pustulosus]